MSDDTTEGITTTAAPGEIERIEERIESHVSPADLTPAPELLPGAVPTPLASST